MLLHQIWVRDGKLGSELVVEPELELGSYPQFVVQLTSWDFKLALNGDQVFTQVIGKLVVNHETPYCAVLNCKNEKHVKFTKGGDASMCIEGLPCIATSSRYSFMQNDLFDQF